MMVGYVVAVCMEADDESVLVYSDTRHSPPCQYDEGESL